MARARILHVYPGQMVHHLRGMLKNDPVVFSRYENDALLMVAGVDAFSQSEDQQAFLSRSRHPVALIGYVLRHRPEFVLFHSGFWPKSWIFMVLTLLTGVRCVLISWGGDLEPATSRKGKLLAALRQIVLRHFYAVVFLAEGDRIRAQRIFGSPKRSAVIAYYNPAYLEGADQRSEAPRTGAAVRVQVGNDASEVNGHDVCLRALDGLKADDIQVVLPFGYGRFRSDYMDRIRLQAAQAFGSGAEIHEHLMPKAEFDALIETCDAYMMASPEQRALYSVYRHLAAGHAVFLPKDAGLKRDLEALGFEIQALEDIAALDAAAFKRLCRSRNMGNIACAQAQLSFDAIRGAWRALLTSEGRGVDGV